jgi:hypothetical protein
MDVKEFAATIQQLVREREALNEAYEDLQAQMTSQAEEARRTGVKRPREEAVPDLLQLVVQLGNFVNMEREHGDKLYALLLDALRRLAEAYEIQLPPGWPDVNDDDPTS